jgi:hypothetical protein
MRAITDRFLAVAAMCAGVAVGCVTIEQPDGDDDANGSQGAGGAGGSGGSASNDAPCMQAFDRAKSCFAAKDCATLEPPYDSACEQARTLTYDGFKQALCQAAGGGTGASCACDVASATQINTCTWDSSICACVY